MPKSKKATKLCYVIMPFSKTKTCTQDEWTDIFESIIKPAVEAAGLGYQCLRSEATTGNMIRKIVNSLSQANVVIADLTDRNPNVFYELGVRHTLKNRTIMMAQRREDIPSDLHGYASHVYKWKTTVQKRELTKKLRRLLHHIEEDTDRSDNPVSDFLHERSIRIFEFQHEENSRKLRALIGELLYVSAVLEAHAEVTGDLPPDESKAFVMNLSIPALDHLIATQYVYAQAFSHQASGLRTQLSFIAGREMAARYVANALGKVSTFKKNAEALLAAYEAGDSLDEIELDDLPRLND